MHAPVTTSHSDDITASTMASTSSTPLPPHRRPRKPTFVYTLDVLTNGAVHLQSTPTPVPVAPTPTPAPASTAATSSSSEPHPHMEHPSYRRPQHIIVPRGEPYNVYTYQPPHWVRVIERAKQEKRKEQLARLEQQNPKNHRGRGKRSAAADSKTESSTGGGGADKGASGARRGAKKGKGGKTRATTKEAHRTSPRVRVAELHEDEATAPAPTPKRATRRNPHPLANEIIPTTTRSTRSAAHKVDAAETESHTPDVDIDTTPRPSAKGKGKPKAEEDPSRTPKATRSHSKKSASSTTEEVPSLHSSASSSSSVSPILTPSPELTPLEVIVSSADADHIGNDTNSSTNDTSIQVKRELLAVTDMPSAHKSVSPSPSPALSDASNASSGSKKRRRHEEMTPSAASVEPVEAGKTRSGRVIKKRKMD